MAKTTLTYSKTMFACVLSLFLIFSVYVPVSYAEELSYDEKLEFLFKTEQIAGHMISALDNIIQKEYDLAKMHLIHPAAEHSDAVDYLPEDSICSQKLPLVLTMLQFTEPEFDRDVTDQRFSYVFQVLRECNNFVAGSEMTGNLNFNLHLLDKLLEKSTTEYALTSNLIGMGKQMEYQDALGLVMRAHMLVSSSDILYSEYVDTVGDSFKELFIAYQNEASSSKITLLTNQIRDDTRILHGTEGLSNSTINYDLITPTVYLKSLDYSTDLQLLELRGENFDDNQNIKIEYFSPSDKKSEILSGTVSSDGEFHFPLEFIDREFNEPMMFTITVGNTVFYEILAIS